MFSAGSGEKVWWKCSKGHAWQATINSRNSGTGCPFCSGQKAIVGESDLATTNPLLANEWDYTKNEPLKPSDFKSGSCKKVWWKCSKGHEWQATISSRNVGSGCPYCSGLKVVTGVNDLASKFPHIAKQWNYDKNGSLLPSLVSYGTARKVWWKCAEGHEWMASVNSRTNRKSGCPYCYRQKTRKN